MLRMKEDTRVLDCATPSNFSFLSVCLTLGQIDAVGQGAHDLVEHVHDLRPRALQLLDDLHARDELLLRALEVVDLLDLLVEPLDLGAQRLVAPLLRVDHRAEQQVGGERR